MIYYIASNTYNQTIYSTIQEQGIMIVGQQVHNRFSLLKFLKTSINQLSSLDYLLLDTSFLIDTEEEILQAIKMYRTVNEEVRIIVFSPERVAGDYLLSQIFAFGIWNIIASMDYLEIKLQLEKCLSEKGKSFKDALEFKDIKKAEQLEKSEIKAVNKVMVGMVGSKSGIGVTHNSIIMANSLRKKGFLVAILEVNHSSNFEKIRNDFGMKVHDHSYFTMNGIDYYCDVTENSLKAILEKSYNFIIMDFGPYNKCNVALFSRCHVRMVIAGTKAWELEYVTEFLSQHSNEELRKIHFYFNFTDQKYEKTIRKEMKLPDGNFLNVHFLEYFSDPFNVYDIRDIDTILAEYLPAVKEEKGRFFKRKKR